MNYSEHWDRWIKASVAKHFKPCNENIFVEGFSRNTEKLKDWVEVRMDGPYIRETTKGMWHVQIEVNLLVVVNEQENAYRMEELKGKVARRFLSCLNIYRLGEKEPDDNTLLGNMRLAMHGKERLTLTNFGKIRPDTNQYQASVEGHYDMFLS